MTAKSPWEKEGTSTKTPEPAAPPVPKIGVDVADPKSATSVWIGCKLPGGIWLELIPSHEGWNPPPTGPRVRLNGSNTVQREMILRVNPRVLDFGRTSVDKSFWEQWLKANQTNKLVTNGFIFAEDNVADFKAHARGALGENTGLEGLNPEGKDERMAKIRVKGSPETIVEGDAEHLARLRKSMEEDAA